MSACYQPSTAIDQIPSRKYGSFPARKDKVHMSMTRAIRSVGQPSTSCPSSHRKIHANRSLVATKLPPTNKIPHQISNGCPCPLPSHRRDSSRQMPSTDNSSTCTRDACSRPQASSLKAGEPSCYRRTSPLQFHSRMRQLVYNYGRRGPGLPASRGLDKRRNGSKSSCTQLVASSKKRL